jgi:glycogen(starch) synthase
MRVLALGSVYPPHHLGGYEVIWSGVMRHLRAEGHDARVLSTDYRNPRLAAGVPEEPDVHRELEWYWSDHAWRPLGPRATLALERHNAAVLDRHLHEFDPDVVTWWPVGGMSLSLIERVRRAGLPALLFVLDPWPYYGPERDRWIRMWSRLRPLAPLAARLTGIPTRLELATAGRWVFCSGTIRDETLALGIEPPELTVITPGVDRSFTDVPPEPEPTPWRWRLLYAGRVVAQKGVATAIEALALLPAEATLRIVGDGDPAFRAELERTADRAGVRDRVTFDAARALSEMPDVYREADVVVFPVDWPEPWGLVPLEAFAVGRPVVATGRGGSGDYLVDGQNSLLFAAGDAGALAARLNTLAADASLRDRLREGGYATAASHTEDGFNRRALVEIEVAGAAAPGDRAGSG